jgi:hypothetical protein
MWWWFWCRSIPFEHEAYVRYFTSKSPCGVLLVARIIPFSSWKKKLLLNHCV